MFKTKKLWPLFSFAMSFPPEKKKKKKKKKLGKGPAPSALRPPLQKIPLPALPDLRRFRSRSSCTCSRKASLVSVPSRFNSSEVRLPEVVEVSDVFFFFFKGGVFFLVSFYFVLVSFAFDFKRFFFFFSETLQNKKNIIFETILQPLDGMAAAN